MTRPVVDSAALIASPKELKPVLPINVDFFPPPAPPSFAEPSQTESPVVAQQSSKRQREQAAVDPETSSSTTGKKAKIVLKVPQVKEEAFAKKVGSVPDGADDDDEILIME